MHEWCMKWKTGAILRRDKQKQSTDNKDLSNTKNQYEMVNIIEQFLIV